MKRILIVNANWRGDVLFSTPALRALRRGNPGARLACLVVPRVAEVLEGNPNLDEIIVYEEDGRHRGPLGMLKLVSRLRAARFDEVYLFHRSFTRRLLTALAGIPRRIGYPVKRGAFLLTVPVEVPEPPVHKIDYFLRLAEAGGSRPAGRNYEFFFSGSDREAAAEMLRAGGVGEKDRLAVFNPGGNWHLKRWPKENFARLAERLQKEYNFKVAFSGAPEDRILIGEILKMLKAGRALDLSGRTTLKQLAAVFARAGLVVANDSGPMHIAAAVKADLIALFGPTSPGLTGPAGAGRCVVLQKDVGCPVPCYRLDCGDNRCLRAVTVEDVLRAVRDLDKKTEKGHI